LSVLAQEKALAWNGNSSRIKCLVECICLVRRSSFTWGCLQCNPSTGFQRLQCVSSNNDETRLDI